MNENVLEMPNGMYLRKVGPVSVAEKFPNVPGLYNIGGPWKSVVNCFPGPEEGTVVFLCLMDPARAKSHKSFLERHEKEMAEWTLLTEAWEKAEEGPPMEFFHRDKPEKPKPPLKLESPPIVVMKTGDTIPIQVYGEGTFIGTVGDLFFFTFPEQVGASLKGIFGGLFSGG